MSEQDPFINEIIFSKYLVQEKICKGSLGTIYRGINTETKEKIVVKVENKKKIRK